MASVTSKEGLVEKGKGVLEGGNRMCKGRW